MKKRIISLVLVLVTLCLTLASCASYSFAEDDMAQYAQFKDLAGFQKALKEIVIEDGDFGKDPAKRDNKTIDAIYAKLAAAVKSDGEKLEEGTLGAHDIIYYNYYITATKEGKTYYFMDTMKSTSQSTVQLGLMEADGVAAKLAELFAGKDIKDYVYTTETAGSVTAGDVVYISYTCTYPVTKTENGQTVTTTETDKVENERLVLTSGASPFVDYLLTKAAGINVTTIDDVELDGKAYKGIKINWRSNTKEFGSFEDVTYDEKKELVHIVDGEKVDVNGVPLTYHIFPVYYISVPEYTTLNLINYVWGSKVTLDDVATAIFGHDFTEKTDEEKEALLKEYVTKDAEGKDVTLEELVKSIATLQSELATAKKELKSAKDELDKKQKAKDSAQTTYDTNPTEDNLDSLNKANENLTTATTTHTEKETAYNNKLTERDNKVNTLLNVKPGTDTLILDGYKKDIFADLLEAYNEEIRMSLAEEVWALMEEYIVVNSTPEKAVELAYEQLLENYEHEFYNDDYDSSSTNSNSNYKQFGGSFKEFLKYKTGTQDYNTALDKVNKEAVEIVKPIVRIYLAAKTYGITVTDEEYEAYLEDEENNAAYNEYYYGESSVAHAYWFDKLMNNILDHEEKLDENSQTYYEYKNVSYTFETDAE